MFLLLTTIHCLDGKWLLVLQIGQTTRLRSYPHVDGNYALHVYIPSKLIMIFKDCVCLKFEHPILCFMQWLCCCDDFY